MFYFLIMSLFFPFLSPMVTIVSVNAIVTIAAIITIPLLVSLPPDTKSAAAST